MTAIANHLKSLFRASTWAGVAVVLTFGITATNSTQPDALGAPVNKVATAPRPSNTKPLHHWYQFGHASWYGTIFQGHPTASGENYNMYDLTCAHRSLPIGSLVKVTNLRNKKAVVVRVNDRGPVPEDRIVDLSYAAASFIGLRGVAKVRLELLPAEAQLNWPAKADK
jgi:rare lipoprotein A